MSRRTTHNLKLLTLGGLVLLAGVLPMTGCRGDRSDNPPRQFFPDMDDQPRWNPQAESEFFADGRTMRQPPEHTVPFGVSYVISDEPWAIPMNIKRDEFLGESSEVYDGTDDMIEYVTEIPIPVTAELVRWGQSRFNIYCATCHGFNAEGANPLVDPDVGSMVGRRWAIPVPSFHDPKYLPGGERGQDGYFFTVVRKGVGVPPNLTMPGYAHALDTRDSWAVVAYMRALQQSQLGTIQDVPPSEQVTLGAPPPPLPADPEPTPTEGEQ